MKYLIIIQAILVLSSCNSTKQANSSSADEVKTNIELEVKALTQQDSYPGVHSNLTMVRNLKLEISCTSSDEVLFTNLLMDSVKVPLSAMKIGGKIWGKTETITKGDYESIHFTASRNYYDNNATTEFIMDPIIYELSGEVLEKGIAKIEYEISGESFLHDLGSISKLDSQYHP